MSNLLFGDTGASAFGRVRAGWRFLIFLLINVALDAGGGLLLRRAHPSGNRGLLAGEAMTFVVVMLATVGLARLERRPFGEFGLPRRGAFGGGFFQGIVWGIAGLALLLVLIRVCGDYSFGAVTEPAGTAARYALIWGAMFLLVGFFEETAFRGYALVTLRGGMGFWPAAILMSILFGAIHITNPGEDWMGAVSAGLIGLFFCFTFLRTGSLWFAIGLHAGWDWAESYLFGVPDSGIMVNGHLLNPSFHGSKWLTGGAVGPEGSLMVLLVIAAFFVLFSITHPATKEG